LFERYFKRMKLNEETVLFTGIDRLLLPVRHQPISLSFGV
jgi:hypothetical protein